MGEKIKGTNVAAVIAPFTTDDTYATHDAKYGKGGYRTVGTIEERNNIPEARLTKGMLVYVESEDKIYKLLQDSNDEWYWSELTIGSGGVDSYTHIQTSPSNIWNIQHNLDRYPSATIMVEIDNKLCVVMSDVEYVDNNNIKITFASEYSGQAYLI